jgi:hypothetical protein
LFSKSNNVVEFEPTPDGRRVEGGAGVAKEAAVMTPPAWEGDRELAKQRFLMSVTLAVEAMPAVDLNFFAWRILFQMDRKDRLGLQAELEASLEAERRGKLELVGKSQAKR